ncbi:MAG TPA: efflux RND transporter periplasmic adaptor subunit [Usitatibacter sp.]|nr:efflux RND transporter periplasmic adaptor subunit [Usitatibacter sp.]
MSGRVIVAGMVSVALVAAGVAGGMWWAQRSMGHSQAPSTAGAQPGKKVLYWHDPMYPQHKFDKPGKSPFMDMQLVPVYAEEQSAGPGVKVDPRLAQNLGVRTVVAEAGRIERKLEAVGTIAFDERAVEVVQSRTNGFIEELFVRAPLDPVRRGQPLARIFVPEWAGAQQEYLALKASATPGAEELARAARNRLLLLGMVEEQVRAVDREGKPVTRITLHSPIDGVVGELGAREGMNVSPGTTLFRLNGLGTVWVNLDVPETQAGAIRPGAPITATVPAYPGETFSGRIAAVLPEVASATRTLKARVELANKQGKLKPGMFASVAVGPIGKPGTDPKPSKGEDRGPSPVLVPSEAVIVTGERSVVIVDRGEGRFEPVEVKIGSEHGGRTEILSGIEPGTRVVASGQFLIDSEASLRGIERRMEGAASATPPAQPATPTHKAEGVLQDVDGKSLLIKHGAIPTAGMGAMTMEFLAPESGMPAGLKAGDAVAFEFVMTPKGEFQATRVERRASP